jgi:hypothetical protein
MAEYSASFREGGALQFGQDSVRDLVKAATDFTGEAAQVTIEFRGDHKIAASDLDQLLNDSYVRSLMIISIRIDSSRYRPAPRRTVDVKISSEYLTLGAISVSIDGDRDASIVTRDRIEKIVRGCWTWYSRFYRPFQTEFQVARVVVVFIIVFLLLFAAFLILRGIPHSPDELAERAAEALLLSPSFYFVLAFLRNRLFPKLLFNLGKSADVAISAAYWRNIIFVGVGLAIVAGIATALITDRFK